MFWKIKQRYEHGKLKVQNCKVASVQELTDKKKNKEEWIQRALDKGQVNLEQKPPMEQTDLPATGPAQRGQRGQDPTRPELENNPRDPTRLEMY